MTAAITALEAALAAAKSKLEEAEKAGDLAAQADLIVEQADLELAIKILTPIGEASQAELDRWRNGYARLRDHCIEKGYDLTT